VPLEGIAEELAWARHAIETLDGERLKLAVREATDDLHAAAVANWNATATMSSRNTAGRGGTYRTTHRTQRYREAIRRILFDEGLTGKVYVGYPVRSARGTRPAKLPAWLEYGTATMSARPHLMPAWRVTVARFNAAIEALLGELS
jgi:hypothetical protein